ncbi:MAG: WCX domain-containing protein [Roseinatronobacter sp.]
MARANTPADLRRSRTSGRALARLEASGLVEMAWHLYKWGDAVEVVEPATLREMVARFQNDRITVLP